MLEPCCSRKEHAIFNASLINKFILEGSDVTFFATADQIKSVDKHVNNSRSISASYEPISKVPKNSFFSSIFFFLSFFKDKDGPVYFFSSVNTFHLVSLTILNYFFNKTIFIIPHAVLETSYLDKSLKSRILFFKRLPFWLYLFSKNSNNKLILLSKSIALNFDALKGYGSRYFIIDYPNIYKNEFFLRRKPEHIVKIALIGVCDEMKGGDWLINEVNSMNTDRFKFYLLGENKLSLKTGSVIEPCNSFIPEEEYKELISDMDYFIYPFPQNRYRLRASGTLFDAISLRKPIITSRNSFIVSFLTDNDVDFILFDRQEGLSALLSKLNQVSDEQYYSFQNTLNKFVQEHL